MTTYCIYRRTKYGGNYVVEIPEQERRGIIETKRNKTKQSPNPAFVKRASERSLIFIIGLLAAVPTERVRTKLSSEKEKRLRRDRRLSLSRRWIVRLYFLHLTNFGRKKFSRFGKKSGAFFWFLGSFGEGRKVESCDCGWWYRIRTTNKLEDGAFCSIDWLLVAQIPSHPYVRLYLRHSSVKFHEFRYEPVKICCEKGRAISDYFCVFFFCYGGPTEEVGGSRVAPRVIRSSVRSFIHSFIRCFPKIRSTDRKWVLGLSFPIRRFCHTDQTDHLLLCFCERAKLGLS